MYFSGSQYILLAALVTSAYATVMVKLVDGSFAPWDLSRRAPGDGLPLILTNHDDMSYLTTVLMGTPFQQVEMSPSLSQNLISVARAPPGVSSNTYYNPATSSSYTPGNAAGTVPGISGQTISGTFSGEYCMLQAINSATFAYNASVLLTSNSVSDELYPVGARGVLGYGLNGPTTPVNASLIPTFLPANFTFAVCGIELNHKDDPVPDGRFTMGAVDASAYTGDFTNVLVPADTTVSWSVPFDTLTYGGSGGVNQSLTGLVASIDLYHSVIQVSTAMASQIYSSISGAQAMSETTWSIPCDSKFPITLTFSGKPFTINERDTVVKLPNGTCQGALTGGAQGIGKVGAPFMRNFYTRFGAEKHSNGTTSLFVGFAAKNLRSKPSVSTTTLLTPTTVTAGPAGTGVSSGASGVVVQDAILLSALAIASIVAFIL